MKTSNDCPGRFKCHGPATWCDKCGDVDLVCDDPKCDAHMRGEERRQLWLKDLKKLREIEVDYKDAVKHEAESRALYERWRDGLGIMVARKQPPTQEQRNA